MEKHRFGETCSWRTVEVLVPYVYTFFSKKFFSENVILECFSTRWIRIWQRFFDLNLKLLNQDMSTFTTKMSTFSNFLFCHINVFLVFSGPLNTALFVEINTANTNRCTTKWKLLKISEKAIKINEKRKDRQRQLILPKMRCTNEHNISEHLAEYWWKSVHKNTILGHNYRNFPPISTCSMNLLVWNCYANKKQ